MFKYPDFTKQSNGGTETMCRRIEAAIHESGRDEILEDIDFYPSRVRDFDPDRPSVLYLHDLADDPEAGVLIRGGDSAFDLLVFVSHWQYQQYQKKFNLSGSNAVIINNGIENIEEDVSAWEEEVDGKIRFIYHTTPHRGLELLVPAFAKLAEKYPDKLHLDVYSSFGVYGWAERDEQFKVVIDACKNHPDITYHGTVSNDEIRKALTKAHIFAYPNIWPETSCLSLIEAMASSCLCIHPNHAALAETSGGTTIMYPYKLDMQEHLEYFTTVVDQQIQKILDTRSKDFSVYDSLRLAYQRAFEHYNWDTIKVKWLDILKQLQKAVAQDG